VGIVTRISGKIDNQGDLAAIGSVLRSERKTQGLSQEALADAANIDRSHMGRIERGERNLTVLNLIRIARALDQLPSQLLAQARL
jgi:transcriptional regulator with XRE-family HTH domain